MRLIDADVINYDIIKLFPRSFETVDNLIDAWRELMAEQPIAYELDKVIECLEGAGNIKFQTYTKPLMTVEDAIKIVKSGCVTCS